MFSYDWNFSRLTSYTSAFADGILFTIALSIVIIVFSTCLGVIWGVGLHRGKLVRLITQPLVDVLKALPPLVLVLFGYYFFVSDVVGVTVPAFWSVALSLGLNVAAFIADLTRAAISNAPKEIVDTGRSFGLRDNDVLRYVIMPIALRELLVPMSYLYIETIKLTSLASVVSVRETVYVAQAVIVDTSRSLEVWVIVGLIYLALIIPLTWLVRFAEQRLKAEAGLKLEAPAP